MLILRGLKGEKNMANICAVILGAGKAARIENMANVTVAGRGIVKWALEAAHSAAEDVFIATDDEAVISQANGGARAIGGGIIELVQSIAEYDRAVLLCMNQIVSKKDAEKLGEATAPCAALTHEGREMLAWSIDTAVLKNAAGTVALLLLLLYFI